MNVVHRSRCRSQDRDPRVSISPSRWIAGNEAALQRVDPGASSRAAGVNANVHDQRHRLDLSPATAQLSELHSLAMTSSA